MALYRGFVLVSQSKPRVLLPVDASLAQITATVASHPAVIIKAEPGAGKTTRVPEALLATLTGQILVLEPRRLAARLSAERIADERGEACGDVVGFQIRMAAQLSARTRLLFVTEGIFLRLVLADPELKTVAAVVIDEFHERHLHTDLALAIVRSLQQGARPDLKLLVMSATLQTSALAAYLEAAPVFDIPGRTFPVAITYLPQAQETALENRVAAAVDKMRQDPDCPGDILVFLSGMQEIRRCASALAKVAGDWQIEVLPLAADLPSGEQARVFQPSPRRKVILATNVAETSLTIPGVTGVLDVGTAKIAGHASWSGLPTLEVKKISQASAIQRSGRAGRTAAGVAYRLYSEGDFLSRPAFTAPDIHRLDLADTLLSALALRRLPGPPPPLAALLPWFEAPEVKAADAAAQLLNYLGATDLEGALTSRGRAMAKLPLHPRLAAVVQRGSDLGCTALALAAACLISDGMLLPRSAPAASREASDILAQIGQIHSLLRGRNQGGDALLRKARQIASLYDQLARRLRLAPWPAADAPDSESLILCLLAGFPERVAKRRVVAAAGGSAAAKDRRDRVIYNFCLGRSGVLAPSSVVSGCDLILALDAAEESTHGGGRETQIYAAAALNVEHLLDSPAALLSDVVETIWTDAAQRVDVVQKLVYGQLVVSETKAAVRSEHATAVETLLQEKLAEHWPKPFADAAALDSYHARLEALKGRPEQADYPHFSGEMLELLQAAICTGKRSFKEIAAKPLVDYITEQLPDALNQLLQRVAPGTLRLANGKQLALTYTVGQPVFASGFIQDFYGLTTTPQLPGQGPLTLHLLGPNRRSVQVTNDLPGFWQRHYPAVRSGFVRRYPRHHWADEPWAAKPFLYYNQLKASELAKPKL